MGYRFIVRSFFALRHAALLSPRSSHQRHAKRVPRRWRAVGCALALLLGSAAGFMLHAQTAQPGQVSVNFGNASIGSPSSPTPVTFTFTSGGSGITTSVVTQGAKGLDFTNAGGGTCDTNGSNYTYNTGDSCTVNVAFTPKYAGTRYGAAELLNSSGAVIATVLTCGTGLGPQLTKEPQLTAGTSLASLGGGLILPRSLAVDGNGNVYVIDGSVVKEIPPGCTSSTCMTTVGGGFNSPSHIAVDGAANLYVSDSANNAIYEIPPGCVSSGCVKSVGSFNTPLDVAVDPNGNLYVLEAGATTVTEVPPGCSSTTCETLLGGGFVYTTSLAVDPGGNVYVAGNIALKKMPPGCTDSSCVTVVLSNFLNAGINDVAVDGRGEVYFTSHHGVFEMAPDCASDSCVVNMGGEEQNYDVVADGAGNVYFTTLEHWVVEEVRSSLPTQLSFLAPVGGSDGTDIYLTNIGNAPLTFSVPATGENPSVPAPFFIDQHSTCPEVTPSSSPVTLAAGASCYLGVGFAPTSVGTFTGTFLLTDNTLNIPNATQSIVLTGTFLAQYGPASVEVTPALSPITTTQNLAVTVRVYGGTPIPTGSVTLTGGSYASGAIPLTAGSATIIIPAGQLPVGRDSLAASYTPDSSSYLLYNSSGGLGDVTVTQGIGSCTTPNPNPNPNPASFANPGDYNGDCKSDILWRNSNSDEVYTWSMNGLTIASQGGIFNPSSDWVIQGTGDFDGDGKSDILWRNTSTGEVYLWFMNGTSIASQASLGPITSDWVIQGVGDFNGDGKSDILWRNSTSGLVYLWLMNGSTVASRGAVFNPSLDWVIQGAGDFDGDGKADILWRNSASGQIYLWLMNGMTITSQGSLGNVSSDSVIQGVGDFNSDGKSDILWRSSTSGLVYVWIMNGISITNQGAVFNPSSDWVIQGVGDFNGDGVSDILWRNSSTGEVYIWFMNATSITSQGSPATVTSDWQIEQTLYQ